MWPSADCESVGTLGRNLFSRLDSPACMPPVNASPTTFRTPAHDSGPMWYATPSSYGTCTHCLSPVLIGAPAVLHLFHVIYTEPNPLAPAAMPRGEGSRKSGQFIALCLTPDVCKTPMGTTVVPVPYQIIASLSEVTVSAPTSTLQASRHSYLTAARLQRWSEMNRERRAE